MIASANFALRGLFLFSLTLACAQLLTLEAQACTDPGPPPDFWIQFDPTPGAGSCPADFNFDGVINTEDFNVFGQFHMEPACAPNTSGPSCPGDLNGDGLLTAADFDLFAAALAVGFCNTTAAWITIHNYTSFGANPGQFCACGLAPLGPVLKVDSMMVVDSTTGQPVPGFDFVPNNTTSGGFNAASGNTANFVSFLSSVTQAIPPGFPIELKFHVSVPDGTQFQEVKDAYLPPGSSFAPPPLAVATDEADEEGDPTGGHQSLQAANSVEEAVHIELVPAMGTLATVLTIGAFLGTGYLRHRKSVR